MSEPERLQPVAGLCELLGFSRQAYYKRRLHALDKQNEAVLETSIILYCMYLRLPEHLPQGGCRELYLLCQEHFEDRFTIGRDRFYDLLRANGLMLRKKRTRPKTTNSNHRFQRYEDLLNTEPKFVAQRPGELVVADITYLNMQGGFAYLSLITDAYSRCIVGYCVHPTLEVEGPLKALQQAFRFYKEHGIDTHNMIHHSDRGVQYASGVYTDLLKARGCRISMTQTGDPLHNALAERMNNTLKNSWYISSDTQSLEQANKAVAQAVLMYNQARPHQAIGGATPMQMLQPEAKNPLVLKGEDKVRISSKLYSKLNPEQKAKLARVNLMGDFSREE